MASSAKGEALLMPGPRHRRREPRYPVVIPASFRNASGSATTIELRNISRKGLRFESAKRMGVGDYFTISLGPLAFIDAQVKWRSGDVHGARFLEPLHQAALDHLRCFVSRELGLLAEGESEPEAPVSEPPSEPPPPSFFSVLTRVLLGDEFRTP